MTSLVSPAMSVLCPKKEVFKFRSVRSIVIAPSRTGRDRRRSRAQSVQSFQTKLKRES